jgi:hypothetical protein
MPRKRDILSSIDALAQNERAFFDDATRFLAPVLPARPVGVRIGGVVCRMKPEPATFAGFGVFQPVTDRDALLDRKATLAERRDYLQLLPRTRLILLGQDLGPDASRCSRWLALPAQADGRLRATGPLPVSLVTDAVDPLDTVIARFDGSTFWFDQRDPRASPATAAYLRQHAVQRTPASSLERSGLTRLQREAYALYLSAVNAGQSVARHLRLRDRSAPPGLTAEQRVRDALEHGGAVLRELAERDGDLRVTYDLHGRRHTSHVRPKDLSIRSAGVCLAGGDAAFDLASLVGVLREGYRRNADDFW